MHELTPEERSRGGQHSGEVRREKRDEARRTAAERLAGMTDDALTRLEKLLLAEDDQIAARAIREVLDRVLGRPRQALELAGEDGGTVEIVVNSVFADPERLARTAEILAKAGALRLRDAPAESPRRR